ncbi:MOS1T transposase, partial [Pseudoatta argentina]
NTYISGKFRGCDVECSKVFVKNLETPLGTISEAILFTDINRISTKDINGTPTRLDIELSSKLSSSEISDNSSSNGIFHCRAIRDVYISKMKENIPSYVCTSYLRKLNDPIILASDRFNIPAILILKPEHENYDIRNIHPEKRPLYAQRHDKVILLHDNARPHVAKPVKTYLETLKWEVLPHPPYSPDIAPSDFHLFRSMAHGLADRRFHSYEEA